MCKTGQRLSLFFPFTVATTFVVEDAFKIVGFWKREEKRESNDRSPTGSLLRAPKKSSELGGPQRQLRGSQKQQGGLQK